VRLICKNIWKKIIPKTPKELAWYMAHCFSIVDNLKSLMAIKFVKAVIELPFTGEFVTDGRLPNILVNMEAMNS